MWEDLLLESGLTQREVRSIMVLGQNQNMRASELAKELDTTRLDAYNSLSRLQEMGIVTATADRPMRFSSSGSMRPSLISSRCGRPNSSDSRKGTEH